MKKFLASAALAIASMSSVLGLGFTNVMSAEPSPTYKDRQSKASKKFHRTRAVEKRARKGRILHGRVNNGSMQYSDAHKARHAFHDAYIANGSSIAEADRAFDQVITKPLTGNEFNDFKLEDMTVAELLEIGRHRGAKVTTKMTKAVLIETIRSHKIV